MNAKAISNLLWSLGKLNFSWKKVLRSSAVHSVANGLSGSEFDNSDVSSSRSGNDYGYQVPEDAYWEPSFGNTKRLNHDDLVPVSVNESLRTIDHNHESYNTVINNSEGELQREMMYAVFERLSRTSSSIR